MSNKIKQISIGWCVPDIFKHGLDALLSDEAYDKIDEEIDRSLNPVEYRVYDLLEEVLKSIDF